MPLEADKRMMQRQNVSGGYGSPAIMLQNVAIKQTVTKA